MLLLYTGVARATSAKFRPGPSSPDPFSALRVQSLPDNATLPSLQSPVKPSAFEVQWLSNTRELRCVTDCHMHKTACLDSLVLLRCCTSKFDISSTRATLRCSISLDA
jgi:hypothetical protein